MGDTNLIDMDTEYMDGLVKTGNERNAMLLKEIEDDGLNLESQTSWKRFFDHMLD